MKFLFHSTGGRGPKILEEFKNINGTKEDSIQKPMKSTNNTVNKIT
jgi:hypothetical protein